MKGENVMSIGKVFGSMCGYGSIKSAVNFAKKKPLIVAGGLGLVGLDRKSTRLNSSHRL